MSDVVRKSKLKDVVKILFFSKFPYRLVIFTVFIEYNLLIITSEPKEQICNGDEPAANFQTVYGNFDSWGVRNRVWLFAESIVAETWKPYFTCFNKTYVGRGI